MAQGDQLAGALGGHDAGYPGHAQHIAFFHGAAFHGGKGIRIHGNDAVGRGLPGRDGLFAHVHHHGVSGGIKMCQIIFTHIFFTLVKLPLRGSWQSRKALTERVSAVSEAAVGPVALGAAQAEAALTQTGDILGGDGVIGQQAGQQQVKNGTLGVHHTAG